MQRLEHEQKYRYEVDLPVNRRDNFEIVNQS